MTHRSTPGVALILTLALAGVNGCSSARVEQPLTAAPIEPMDFWHQLHDLPLTSNDEAMHGLLLLVDGQDPSADYAARVQTLRERGLLAGDFQGQADEAVRRGTVAVVLVKALDIEGGVMMRLLGPVDRYAVRELNYLNIFPPSSPHQTFSGAQFVAVVGRVEDYQRSRKKEEAGS